VTDARSIEFVRWPYDDEAWHVTIHAADAEYCVEQEFYAYPSELLELANSLRAFPAHRADEVVFEAGSKEPTGAHWVALRVLSVDVAGHAAITVDVGNNGDVFRARSARFTIRCDVASINRLGEGLCRWLREPGARLHQALYSS
jgi:hypothetical protein